MHLGLDISTSITGASVVDDDGDIAFCEAWDLRNKKHFPTLWHKIDFVVNRLRDLQTELPITNIFIEPALLGFTGGKTNANTMNTLIKFNGMVSYEVYKIFGKPPEYIPATSARKKCGISVKRGQKAKDVVMKHLIDNDPSFKVEFTSHGNPKPRFYDMADSLIIARAGLECLKERSES